MLFRKKIYFFREIYTRVLCITENKTLSSFKSNITATVDLSSICSRSSLNMLIIQIVPEILAECSTPPCLNKWNILQNEIVCLLEISHISFSMGAMRAFKASLDCVSLR